MNRPEKQVKNEYYTFLDFCFIVIRFRPGVK